MDKAKQARAVLAEAERKLRELVGTAAGCGEYDTAVRLTDWARAIGALACDAETFGSTIANGADYAARRNDFGSSDGARTGKTGDKRTAVSREASLHRNTITKRGRRTPPKGEYPKFTRCSDHLVKIGWSKKGRAEYEHKAPRGVVDALIAAIVRRSGNGKLFTVEDLLPLKDTREGSEIPGYQAYVALAWLKSAGLVKQHGRQGYSVRKATQLAEEVTSSWLRLSEQVV